MHGQLILSFAIIIYIVLSTIELTRIVNEKLHLVVTWNIAKAGINSDVKKLEITNILHIKDHGKT
jgi:hypothetical protein